MLSHVISLLLDLFIVSFYFILGVLYAMALLQLRKKSKMEGRTMITSLAIMWFLLMSQGIVRIIMTMGAFITQYPSSSFMDDHMVLNIVVDLLSLPVLMYLVYATMKRNIESPIPE